MPVRGLIPRLIGSFASMKLGLKMITRDSGRMVGGGSTERSGMRVAAIISVYRGHEENQLPASCCAATNC